MVGLAARKALIGIDTVLISTYLNPHARSDISLLDFQNAG